ncbi:MAG: ORF6N domain-containing protein [Opitutaceae bacterium]
MPKKAADPALPRIFAVRRQKVVLDGDLAALYGVPTRQLNQAVQRNASRFPSDFCFQLTPEEVANLKSQVVTSSLEDGKPLRSQNVTLKTEGKKNLRSQNAILENERHGGARKLPWVLTEHGALMAANVLRSPKAVQMSLYLVRAFVSMREQLASNLSVLRRLAEIDKKLIEHDVVLREVLERLQPLLDAPDEDDEAKPKIGFHKGNR